MSISYTVYASELGMNEELIRQRCYSLGLTNGYDVNIYPTHWLITYDDFNSAVKLDKHNKFLQSTVNKAFKL